MIEDNPLTRLSDGAQRELLVVGIVLLLLVAPMLVAAQAAWTWDREIGPGQNSQAVDVAPNSSYIVDADNTDAVVFNTSNDSEITTLSFGTEVESIAISPDESQFAIGTESGDVYIYSAGDWTQQQQLTQASDTAVDIEWRGTYLIQSALSDQSAYVYNTSDWSLRQTLTDPTGKTAGVGISPNQTKVAVGSYDNNLYVYDTSNWSLDATLSDGDEPQGVEWSPDGEQLASGTGDSQTYIYDTSGYNLVATLYATDRVLAVDWSREGNYLATTGNDKNVHVHDTATWDYAANLSNQSGNVRQIRFDGTGSYIAATTGLNSSNNAGPGEGVQIYNSGASNISAAVTVTVTDGDGDPVEGAEVRIENDTTVLNSGTTDANGEFTARPNVNNSTALDVVAEKDGVTATKTITYDPEGSDVDVSLTLNVDDPRELVLKPDRRLLNWSESTEYTVIFRNESGGHDVTDQATVTSANSTVVAVDQQAKTFTATSNENISARVNVTGNYSFNGTDYTAENFVVVSDGSLDDFLILPPEVRFPALLSDDGILAVLVATLFGILGGRVTNAWGGIALMTLCMVAAWFGGFIGLGLALVAVFTGSWLGLNLAANIDYEVQS